MAVTLNKSDTAGFGKSVFPDDSVGMVVYQAAVVIPQYNMIAKYDLKGYADQGALPEEQQKLMDTSVEAVDGDIVLKFKNLLVQEGVTGIIVYGPHIFIYAFFATVGEGHDSNRGEVVNNLCLCGRSKVSYPNQYKLLYHGILADQEWVFLTLLAVGADILKYLLSPGPTWFKPPLYCNLLNLSLP